MVDATTPAEALRKRRRVQPGGRRGSMSPEGTPPSPGQRSRGRRSADPAAEPLGTQEQLVGPERGAAAWQDQAPILGMAIDALGPHVHVG